MTWQSDKRFWVSSFLLIGCSPFCLILIADLLLTLVLGPADPYMNTRLLTGFYATCSCYRIMGGSPSFISTAELVFYFFSWTIVFVLVIYASLTAILFDKQRLFSLLRHLLLLTPIPAVFCYLGYTGIIFRDAGCGDPIDCEFDNFLYWGLSVLMAVLVVWIGEKRASKVQLGQNKDNN